MPDKLRAWHDDHKPDTLGGEFGFVQRCRNQTDWQISYDLYDDSAKSAGVDTFYFLVRQLGQYQYVMLGVDSKRQPDCPGEAFPDENRPSLFQKPPEVR